MDATFLALFSLLLILYIAMWDAFRRRDRAFTFTMSMGLLCEVLGYAARLWSGSDQLRPASFFMQISCLAVGPTFLASGLYLCLARLMISHTGVANLSQVKWQCLVLIVSCLSRPASPPRTTPLPQ